MIIDILKQNNSSDLIRWNKEEVYKVIPDLKKCDGFDQLNDYHIYDVLEHILVVLDNVGDDYLLKIAALFHDIGKPNCFTKDDNGIGHFFGHWDESVIIFDKYKDLFKLNDEDYIYVKNLIQYHDLRPVSDNMPKFKELFGNRVNGLLILKKADILAQNPKYNGSLEEIDNLLNNI